MHHRRRTYILGHLFVCLFIYFALWHREPNPRTSLERMGCLIWMGVSSDLLKVWSICIDQFTMIWPICCHSLQFLKLTCRCTCVFTCACMCVCVHACRDQRLAFSVFFHLSPPCFWRQGFSLNLAFTDLIRVLPL